MTPRRGCLMCTALGCGACARRGIMCDRADRKLAEENAIRTYGNFMRGSYGPCLWQQQHDWETAWKGFHNLELAEKLRKAVYQMDEAKAAAEDAAMKAEGYQIPEWDADKQRSKTNLRPTGTTAYVDPDTSIVDAVFARHGNS